MAEYQSNSHRSRELQNNEPAREKRVEKVVSNSVKTRENKGRKFTDVFISEDASNVKSYVIMDVIIPAFKKLIYDIFTDGIDMILYGGNGSGKSRNNGGTRVSYRSFSDDKPSRREVSGGYGYNRFDYEDIVFTTRVDAEAVRRQMMEVIERYGLVTVADMYDMAGRTPPFTSNNYGWTSIRSAEPVRVRDGYILRLPKASPID